MVRGNKKGRRIRYSKKAIPLSRLKVGDTFDVRQRFSFYIPLCKPDGATEYLKVVAPYHVLHIPSMEDDWE